MNWNSPVFSPVQFFTTEEVLNGFTYYLQMQYSEHRVSEQEQELRIFNGILTIRFPSNFLRVGDKEFLQQLSFPKRFLDRFDVSQDCHISGQWEINKNDPRMSEWLVVLIVEPGRNSIDFGAAPGGMLIRIEREEFVDLLHEIAREWISFCQETPQVEVQKGRVIAR